MEKLRSLFRQLPGRDIALVFAGALVVLALIGGKHYMDQHRTPIPYNPAGITAQWIPATVKHWDKQINEQAKKYNIDANVVAIVMTMESGGNAKAVSPDNAQGLMQVTPPTAKDIAAKYLKQPTDHYDLQDPDTNIEFGVAYLAFLRKEFGLPWQAPTWDNNVELVAAGYNGGPGSANSLYTGKGLTDTETVVYSRDAFNMWRERVSKTSPTFDRWKERGGTDLLTAAQTSQTQ